MRNLVLGKDSQATSSSFYLDHGPETAIDGFLMLTNGSTGSPLWPSYFQSDPSDLTPWLQLNFSSPISVSMVMLVALYEIPLGNLTVNVGNNPAMFGQLPGQLSVNPLCADIADNTIQARSYAVVNCIQDVQGQFVQVHAQTKTQLSLQEVVVFSTVPGLNMFLMTLVFSHCSHLFFRTVRRTYY